MLCCHLKQELTIGGAPVASTSLATPAPPVSLLTSVARSQLLMSRVTSGQEMTSIPAASSSRYGLMSARMIRVAPSAAAHWAASSPMGPAPSTRTS